MFYMSNAHKTIHLHNYLQMKIRELIHKISSLITTIESKYSTQNLHISSRIILFLELSNFPAQNDKHKSIKIAINYNNRMNYKTIEERLRAYPHKIKAHQNAYPNQRIIENKSASTCNHREKKLKFINTIISLLI